MENNVQEKLNKYSLTVMDSIKGKTFEPRIIDAITEILKINSLESFNASNDELIVASLSNPFVDCVLKDVCNILEINKEYEARVIQVSEAFQKAIAEEGKKFADVMADYIESTNDQPFDAFKSDIEIDVIDEPIKAFKMGYALSKVKPAPKMYGIVANYINENKEVVYCDVIASVSVSDKLAEEIYSTEYTAIAKYMYDNHFEDWKDNSKSLTYHITTEVAQKMLKILAPFLLRNKIEAPIKTALSTIIEHGISRNGLYNVEYAVSAIYDFEQIDTLSEMYLVMYHCKLAEMKSKSLHASLSRDANYTFYKDRAHRKFESIVEDLKNDIISSESEVNEFKLKFGELYAVDQVLNRLNQVTHKIYFKLPEVIWTINTNVRNGNNTIIAVETKFLDQYLEYFKTKSSFPYIVSKDKYPHKILENMIF